MFTFDYVKTMCAYVGLKREEISLDDIYERFDENKQKEKHIPDSLGKRKANLGYKIALIHIERALMDIARESGDVPEGMSYDDARENLLYTKYPYQEILNRAEENEREAERQYESMNNMRRDNPRTVNEYRFLGLRSISDSEKIDEAFSKRLDTLESEADRLLDSEEVSDKEIVNLNAIFKLVSDSYGKLSNSIRKRELDEKLLTPFNSDASGLYMPHSFSEITYIPHSAINKNKGLSNNLTIFEMNNSFGDMLEVTRLAEVGFGRGRRPDGSITYRSQSELKEYEVVKRYIDPRIEAKRKEILPIMRGGKIVTRGIGTKGIRPEHYYDEDRGGEVFIIYADLPERILFDNTQDPEAKRFVADVLLSNLNMDVAINKNGGYVGDMVPGPKRRGYTVNFNMDRLSLAKDLESIKDRYKVGNDPLIIDSRTGEVHYAKLQSNVNRDRNSGSSRGVER